MSQHVSPAPPPPGLPPPPAASAEAKKKKKKKYTKAELERIKFSDLKALAKAMGLDTGLGATKDVIIDAILTGKLKQKVPKSSSSDGKRPWQFDTSLNKDPNVKRYYKMLKWARLPESQVYQVMLNHRCRQAAIDKVFGKGPPPVDETVSMPIATPDLTRNKTEEFKPSSHPSHPIDTKELGAVEWDGLLVAKKSDTGSSGVIFALLKKGVVVLKSGNTLAEEIFGAWIAQQIGVSVPAMRLCKAHNGERQAVSKALRRTVSTATKISISRILQRSNLGVMEYVNGPPLVELKACPNHDCLKQIGAILVLDVVMNNFDRMPFIWDNQGNAENILFSKQRMFALDNRVVCPTSRQARERHLSKVEQLCRDYSKTGVEATQWADIAQFWETRTMMGKLDKKSLEAIAQGFEEAAKVACSKLTDQKLQEMQAKLENVSEGGNSQFWLTQVYGIDITFISGIVGTLKKYFG